MRVLMLCTKYPLDPGDRYFTNELAVALAAAGHEVQVVAIAWDAAPGTKVHERAVAGRGCGSRHRPVGGAQAWPLRA